LRSGEKKEKKRKETQPDKQITQRKKKEGRFAVGCLMEERRERREGAYKDKKRMKDTWKEGGLARTIWERRKKWRDYRKGMLRHSAVDLEMWSGMWGARGVWRSL